MFKNSINSKIAAAAIAGVLVIGFGGGAVAGSLVTSHDIKNGTIKAKDLSPRLRGLIAKHAKDGADGAQGPKGDTGATGAQGPKGDTGAKGDPGASAGANHGVWVASAGSTIDSATQVTLTGSDTSVENADLNLPIQAQQTVSFTYRLADGAIYGAGSPRVFVEVGGQYINTHDGDPSDAGVSNGDGTFTKTIQVGKNGRIGAAGVVKGGPGTVTVTNLKINGVVINFK